MLKNKIALKRIRNIIFLGLVMVIMLGIYNNTIKNSRAEDRVQLTAQMQDKNGLLLSKEVPVEAVLNSDGTYSIELTDLVDGKRVSKYFAGDGTEVAATTGTVLIATAEQVVENKVSIQLEYDSKQVSNGTNTVAIYNQTLTSNAVTVSGYVPDATTLSAQEIDVATLSEVALPDSNVTIEKAYDITIANYQPSEYGESVNVAISYNPTSSPIVYHIADDNTVTKIDSVLEGRSVKFTANHFSKYAIATQTSGTTDTSTDTNTTTDTTNTTVENTVADTTNTVTNTVANEVTNTVTNTVVENTVANEVTSETVADTEVPVWSKVSSAITETGMDVVIQGTDNASWGYDELTDEKIEVLIDGETADSISETEIEKNVAEKFVEIEKEIDERIDADETLTDEEKTAQKEAEKTAAKESLRAEEIKNKIVVKLQNREDIKENETTKGVKFTVSLSNMEQTTKQIKPETAGTENEEYKPYLEWSGNVGLKIAAGTLTDVYANVSTETIIEDAEKTDRQTAETADKMFRDVIKPEYTYQSSNTTKANNKKSLTVVFDIVDKYFGESTLTAENITLKIDGIDDVSALTKTLTKVEDIEETKTVKQLVDGTETEQEITRKIGARYQLVIENLEQIKLNNEEYEGAIQIIFAPDAQKDTSGNGVLAKTITTQIGTEVGSTGTNTETPIAGVQGSGTTLAAITNANIGEYIDLGNDIVDFNGTTGVTTDDWRIFYAEDTNNDGTTDVVHAILTNGVPPQMCESAIEAGLRVGGSASIAGYYVSSGMGVSGFLNVLTQDAYWNELANGISGATATGAPTADLFIKSYNAKYGTELTYSDKPSLNESFSSLSVYRPGVFDSSVGHSWLATGVRDGLYCVDVSSTSYISIVSKTCTSPVSRGSLRPVVALPASTKIRSMNDVWMVIRDDIKPTWEITTSNVDTTSKEVTLTLKGTDENLTNCTLTNANIANNVKIYEKNNTTYTELVVTKTITNTPSVSNGVVEYNIKLSGFGNITEDDLYIDIAAGMLEDASGNTNEAVEKQSLGVSVDFEKPTWEITTSNVNTASKEVTLTLKGTDENLSNCTLTNANIANNLKVYMKNADETFTELTLTKTITNTPSVLNGEIECEIKLSGFGNITEDLYIDIAAAMLQDASGNASDAVEKLNSGIQVDFEKPTWQVTTSSVNQTAKEVTFTLKGTDKNLSNCTLTNENIANSLKVYVTNDGVTYTELTLTKEITNTPSVSNGAVECNIKLSGFGTVKGELYLDVAANTLEDTSGNKNDAVEKFGGAPLAGQVTNNNIGDYIDLGNDIIDGLDGTTGVTTDDWRIFYVEDTDNNGTTDIVHAILADYLPATQVPASAGLDTDVSNYPYCVWSDTDGDTLVNRLKNTTAWSTFTNGIAGATATGSPTAELLMSSYNTKNGTELVYTDYPILDSGAEDYDLYVPHTEQVSECYGYWLASPEDYSVGAWYVSCNGFVGDDFYFYDMVYGARPVVALPASTSGKLVNDVWKTRVGFAEVDFELDETKPTWEITESNVNQANKKVTLTLKGTDENLSNCTLTSDIANNLKVYVRNEDGTDTELTLTKTLTNTPTITNGTIEYVIELSDFGNVTGELYLEVAASTLEDSSGNTSDAVEKQSLGVNVDFEKPTWEITESNVNQDNKEVTLTLKGTDENLTNCTLTNENIADNLKVYVKNDDGTFTELTLTKEVTNTPSISNGAVEVDIKLSDFGSVTGELFIDVAASTLEDSFGNTSDLAEKLGGTTTLGSQVTNSNIGDYIDLGNDIVNGLDGTTGKTTDDWRILYVDDNNIYAILSSYLPNSTGYATAAGLDVGSYEYAVFSYQNNNGSKQILLDGLNHSTAWNGLANGIKDATVIGSPSAELLVKSYNKLNGTSLNYTSNPNLKNNATTDYDLYIPHTEAFGGTSGYWLSTDLSGDLVRVLFNYGLLYADYWYRANCAVRPVVSLPLNVSTELVAGVWKTRVGFATVDFEAPTWSKSSSSIDRTNEKVSVTLQGTDKNFDKDNSELIADKITVYTQNASTGAYEANEDISKELSTVTEIENGIEYTLTLGNFGTYEGKVAITVAAETLADTYGNENSVSEQIGVGSFGFLQTKVSAITNDNIGDYIDLGNDIIDGTDGTWGEKGLTTDDWRIFYAEDTDSDGTTDIVHAILADYFPNSTTKADGTTYVAGAGLETYSTYPYIVRSTKNRDTLLTGLTTSSYWNELANGISGATATGSPTAELLMNSYNTKNGTNLVYTSYPTLSSSTEDYDLYVPHTSSYQNCYRYWLASPYAGNSNNVWRVGFNGYVGYHDYNSTYSGIRPVVSIPVAGNENLELPVETEYPAFSQDIVDFVKPEIEYNKSATVLDKTNKKLIVEFDVTDSYCNFDFTAGTTFTAADILVKIDGDETADAALSKTLTKVADKTEVVNGESKKVGETYRLEISNLDQIDYSGPINLVFAADVAKDTSGNGNVATTITPTVASNPDEEIIVDYITPVLKTDSIDIDFEYPADATTKDGTTLMGTATATLIGSDKYFDEDYFTSNPIEASDLVVFVDGVETTEGITLELLSQKALTKDRTIDGVTTTYTYGVELEVKVSGFTASTKQIRVGLKEGTVQDTNGNGNTLKDYTEACIIYNTLQSTAAENNAAGAFLGSTSIKRNAITQVIFESNLENINSDTAWNVAAQGDSSIVAWLDANDNKIVHIGSENPIHANADEKYLFYGLTNATAITNIDILNTKNVTNMRGMFFQTGYNAMTDLNLGNNFYTKNVTTMQEMFYQTGYTAMATMNIGDNFDTTNVTSMNAMFRGCGYTKLVELDLKDKFDVRNVTDMVNMFERFGRGSLTHLDLGPKFTKIVYDSYLGEAGKNAPEETVIDVPEAIYIDKNNLKKDETVVSTNIINYTRGTFNLKYYPEWKTVSTAVNGDVLTVVVEGGINENYTAYFGANTTTVEGVTKDLLQPSNISVYADGTQVTGLTVNVGAANKTVDANGNVTAINYTIEVSGFKDANVSGDISLGIAARTLKDEFGNSNLAYEVKDESGSMFIETVEPEITYDSSTFDIAPENKTITINFTISDNYEIKSIAGVEDLQSAEAIAALQNAINVVLEGEGSTATKALSVEEVLTDGEKTLGAKYKLVLSDFGQYYGTVSVAFPDEIAVDKFDNKSIGTSISIADGDIIDFANPTWEADVRDVVINRARDGAAADTVDITFRGLDKEIDTAASTFADASAIEVWVDGTKVDTISKVFASQTAITEEGETKPSAMEYKLTLGNFEANSGEVVIKIPTNTLFDEAGLTAEPKEYTIGIVDFIKPVIENISSTLVDADTVQYTFTVTEKYLPADYELKPEDIKIEVDTETAEGITKTLAIASEDANGKTYTLTLKGFKANDLSGTVYMTIPEGKVTDSSGNKNAAITRAEGQFVDSILPEITYKYSAISNGDDVDNPDIDTTHQTLTVIFDVTDKYFDFDASDLSHDDIKIAIDGKDVTDEVSFSYSIVTLTTGDTYTNGYRYTLTITGLENPDITGNYKDYSGPVQISFAAGIGIDTNKNASVAKNITITDAEEKPIIVDVIAPMWNDKADITINRTRDGAEADTVDITFTGTDKYIDVDASKFDASLIEVYIDGVKVDSIGKTFKEIKALTEEGKTDPYGIQYTLTLDNFETNTGSLTIVVPANVLKDKNGLVCTESKTFGIKVRRDWRVFYKENADTTGDGVNVFLIAADYLLYSKAASIAEDGMMSGYDSSPYGFDLWPRNAELTIDQNVKDKFMLTPDDSEFATSSMGFLTTAYLLDTEKWNIFADSNYATEAIGSPTLEMFAASYNEIMDSLKIKYEMDGTGYGFIYNTNDFVSIDTYIETTNSLFIPHTSKYEGAVGYWLAAPSDGNYRINVNFEGHIDATMLTDEDEPYSIRPVVSLKSDIKATKNEETNAWELSTTEGETLSSQITSANYGDYVNYPVVLDEKNAEGVMVDFVKPVVGNISSQSTTPNIVEYTFTITDDHFAETNDNKLKAEDIKVYVNADEINEGLVKTLTETDITNGKQYTLTFDFTGIDGLDGTTYIDIPAGKIADTSGNTNDGVSKVEGQKVDTIIPEWTYVSKDIYYSATEDVNNDGYTNVERTVEITFTGTDTNYDTNTLTKDVIEVYVNGTKLTTSNAPNLTKTLTDTTSESGITNGVQYTLTITGITGNGALTVKLPGSTLKDTFENVNIATTFSTELDVETDNIAPSISRIAITAPATNTYTVGQEVTIQVTYGEAVYTDRTANNKIDVASEAADMSLTFGEEDAKGTVVKSSVSGNVVTYKYTITAGDNGVLKVASLDDVYDIAGNKVSASDVTPTGNTITADTTAPTLSHIKVTSPASNLYRAGQEITIVATFDENVQGTAPTLGLKFGSTAAKGTVGTGTISGNTITYKYTVTSGDNGELSISSYTGTALTDNKGNAWVAPSTPSNTGIAIETDTTAPVWKYVSKDIYYSTANDAGNDQYANEERTVKITFTGTDTNYETNSLTANAIKVSVDGTELTTTNAPNLSKTLSTATTITNGVQYTLTITGITGDGDLTVTIPENTLEDKAITTSSSTGNRNVETTFSTALDIEADNTSPVINSIKVTSPTPGANQTGAYKVGQEVTIQVTYNDTVYEDITSKNQINATSKAPTMALKFGGTTAKGTVTASSVSGKVITYKYTITAGDNGTLTVSSLEAVYDRAGNEVSASNLTPDNTIIADTTNPTVALRVTSPTTTGMYKAGQEITITATYSEAIYTATPGTTSNKIDTASEASTMSLKFGGTVAKGTVVKSSVSGNVVTYKYTITDGDTGALVVSSLGKVYDRAGNEVSASNVTPNGSVITADTTIPEWTKESSSIIRKRDGATENAVEIVFEGSDDYLKNCTLTSSNIASNVRVFVMDTSGNYVENTTIKKNLVSVSSVANGKVTLKIKLNNFADDFEGKVAIEILGNILYDQAGNGNEATGEIGVGDVSWVEKVDNSETRDWKIFYNNGTNVFLIADDYLPISKAPTTPSFSTLGNYGVRWPKITSYWAFSDEMKDLFMYSSPFDQTEYEIGAFSAVGQLLDANIWDAFEDSTYAKQAVGAPTVEMLLASWNEKYPNDDISWTIQEGTGKLDGVMTGNFIEGRTGLAGGYSVSPIDASSLEGVNDSLYIPRLNTELSSEDVLVEASGYWLASAASKTSNNLVRCLGVLTLMEDGVFGSVAEDGDRINNYLALRPVVCLNSNVTATKNTENDIWNLGTGASLVSQISAANYGDYIDYPISIKESQSNYTAFQNDIVDYAKPEISYTYSESDISTANNTLTVNFDVEDKYFLESVFADSTVENGDTITSSIVSSNIKIKIDGTEAENDAANAKLTKKLVKVEDITTTVDGVSQKTGERYQLVISGFESIDYSGTVQIVIAKGAVTDTSGNTTDPKTITVGIDEPSGEGNAEIVDVIEPVWQKTDSSINRKRDGASEDSVEVVLKGTDKYLKTVNLKASNIGTYIKVYTQNTSGTYVANTSITKTLTDITSVENGEVTATIKLTNFGTYSGKVAVEVQANAIVDESGNANIKTDKIGVGNVDWVETNGTLVSGDNGWRIFYEGDENVFLITTDSVPAGLVSSEAMDISTSPLAYGVEWDYNNLNNSYMSISSTVVNKYLLSRKSTFSTSNLNYKATARLLKTEYWSYFADTDFADSAIGGPTLDMWIESWNQLYPNNKLYYNNGRSYGYYVGTSSNPTSYYISSSNLEGIDNTLFFPVLR